MKWISCVLRDQSRQHNMENGQVDEEVRHARRDELISLQQDIGQQFSESLLGREVSFVSVLARLVPCFRAVMCCPPSLGLSFVYNVPAMHLNRTSYSLLRVFVLPAADEACVLRP